MKKLSNTKAKLKKSVAYNKKRAYANSNMQIITRKTKSYCMIIITSLKVTWLRMNSRAKFEELRVLKYMK